MRGLSSILTFIIIFLSASSLNAQSSLQFDGVDDKATVLHHVDFNLGNGAFTIEAHLNNLGSGSDLTVLSKRDDQNNGFVLFLNTISHTATIRLESQSRSIYDLRIAPGNCFHLAVKRDNSNNVIFCIDSTVINGGNSNKNINITADLVFGKDGITGNGSHQPLLGSIEEIRIWNNARSDADILANANACLTGTNPNLVAYWNIEEQSGQFLHDVTGNGHHAYLGNSFFGDGEDGVFVASSCLTACCNASVSFISSTQTPFAGHWVDFSSMSNNATSYEWTIDTQVIDTTPHFQYSFGLGVYRVQLKVTSSTGCSAYYSEVIEVNETTQYCGEENFTTPEIEQIEFFENLQPSNNPYPRIKAYDRFGNRYLPNDIAIPVPNFSANAAGTTSYSCSCGIFELYFEDMQFNRDYGFDDPILGSDRRAVACRVFEDLSVLLNPTGTLSSNLVKIQVRKSDGKALTELTPIDELSPGVLAAAGPYIIAGYTTGIADGLVYKTITSGTNAIANTPGWNPNSYHGHFRVDFELPNFFLNNATWTIATPINQTDLYTTLLHESFHILGFFSLIDAENGTNLSKLNGTQLYNRYDTYLENTAGTPYIDPITGILNPASVFIGASGHCSADVRFNGTSNPSHDVYLPSPWNISILSHFNCDAASNNGFVNSNGYMMNASINSGEMQRAPNLAEYRTLCDIGYKLNTTFGNSSVGTPANNVPYQTYIACSPPCGVAGIDDNLTGSISVVAGSTVYINSASFIINDNNPNNSYDLTTLLTNFGTIFNITSAGFNFTPNQVMSGTAIIQYHPTCANGNRGSSALIFITVTPIAFPCNIPLSSCNLLCNGDLEQTIYIGNYGYDNNINQFESVYRRPSSFTHFNFGFSSDLYVFNNAGALVSFPLTFLTDPNGVYPAMETCEPNFRTIFNTTNNKMPLPVFFNNGKRRYMGLGVWGGGAFGDAGESFNLHLNQSLVSSPIDNYQLRFWAYTTCSDIDIRMALSQNPPCSGNSYSNLFDGGIYFPVGGYNSNSYPGCAGYSAGTNQGLIPTATFDMGQPVPASQNGWQEFTMNFHVGTANLDELIINASTSSSNSINRYILIDEISIVPLVPQLTVMPPVVRGTPCRGNKVIIEYNICSNMPVSGVNLQAQIPIASGLIFTNNPNYEFVNGQITGLDLGIGGNPLCTLLRLEIEIPIGVSAPNTQNIFLAVTGGTSCTSTNSNLTTSLNIVAGSSLALSVIPSGTGPFNVTNNFTVDVTVANTGSSPISNIVVDIPTGAHSSGLSYTFTPTNIGSLAAGASHTITNIPITVNADCGSARICATITSADGVCLLPSACSVPISIGTNNPMVPTVTTNCSGTASVSVTGGTAPYSFLWDVAAGSQTVPTVAGLAVGAYSITITDANYCSVVAYANIAPLPPFNLTVTPINVTCNGRNNGSATATATGGTGTITYTWNNVPMPQTINNLSPGTYNVIATDVNGCVANASVVITEPTPLNAGVIITHVPCNNAIGGAIEVTATGGTLTYTFLWDIAANSQTNPIAIDLTAGTYCVTVTDANGCTIENCATVDPPLPDIRITKTAPATVITGDVISYIINVENGCSTVVNNIQVVDMLPDGLLGNDLDVNNLYLAGGTSANFTVDAQVLRGVCTGTFDIENIATATVGNQVFTTVPIVTTVVQPTVACTPANINITFDDAITNGLLVPGQNTTISGTWRLTALTGTYTFTSGTTITMMPGAQIIVESNTTLILDNIQVLGCGCLWHRILVQPNGELRTLNTTLQDAQYAIQAQDKAKLDIERTTFRNNFIGIYVAPNKGVGQSIMVTNFRGNNFSSMGIIPPFVGIPTTPALALNRALVHLIVPTSTPTVRVPGLAGIYIWDVTSMNLFDFNGPNNSNRFSRMVSGIVAFQSNLKTNICEFTNINRNDASYATNLGFQGCGIHGQGERSGVFTIEFTGVYPNSPANSFNRCNVGVSGLGVKMIVTQAKMQRIDTMGIRALFCQNGFLSLKGNVMENMQGVGIGVFNSNNSMVEITDNSIEIRQNGLPLNVFRAGIVANSNPVERYHLNIFSNKVDIRTGEFGILVNGYTSLSNVGRVGLNNIVIDGNLANRSGIGVYNSQMNLLCNNVNGGSNTVHANNTFGIVGSVVNGEWSCNSVDMTRTGVFFDGTNTLTLQGTVFNNHRTGLLLSANTTSIGPQNFNGNIWVGNTVNDADNFSIGLYNASRFNINGITAPNDYIPTPLNPTYFQTWIYPFEPGTDFNCNSTGCFGLPFPVINTPVINPLDLAVANNTLSTPSNNAATEYHARRKLYRKLIENPSLTQVDPSLLSFVPNHQTNCIGHFDNIQHGLKQALSISLTDSIVIDSFKHICDYYLDTLHCLDSILYVNYDTLTGNLRNTIANDFSLIMQQHQAFLTNLQTNQQASLVPIQTVNNSFNTSVTHELFEKQVNEIYFNTIAKGILEFTVAELNLLRIIASLCPAEGGAAVHQAQGILSMVEDVNMFIFDCGGNQQAKKGTTESKEAVAWDVVLFPNPTDREVTIQSNIRLENNINIEIYNSLGQNVKIISSNKDIQSISIDVSSLINGVYIIRLTNGDSIITKVFIVAK